MALIVAISSTFIEAKLVNSIPFLEKIYTEGIFGIPGAWVNNLCSLGISAVFGLVFQAQGIAIFVGGMLSIPLSNLYFGAKHQMRVRNVDTGKMKTAIARDVKEAEQWWATNSHYFSELGKTIWALVKLVTLPVRLVMKANSSVHANKAKISSWADSSEFIYQIRERVRS